MSKASGAAGRWAERVKKLEKSGLSIRAFDGDQLRRLAASILRVVSNDVIGGTAPAVAALRG